MENQNPNSTAVRKQPPKIDRLSSLPDGILEEILSLLPTSAAAATSVLSRRWGQLWTRVTRLHFESYDEDLRTFFTSVDSALSRLDSFSNIRYFYLRFNFMAVRSNPTAVELRKGEGEEEDDILYSVLNRCLSRLCGLHTQRIDIGVSYFIQICVQNSVVAKTTNSVTDDDDDVGLESSNCRVICLPQCVFQSETLTELLLNNWFRFKLPEFVNLPNLKKLSLRVFDSYRDLMQTLFKSLPSLEDLTLLSALSPYDDHCIEISAHNLTKICLNFGEACTNAQILIDAPKLEHISIKSFESWLFIRFVTIPSALSSAQLILDARHFLGDDPVNQTMELLKGISCVKSLAIKCLAVGILNRVNMDALPSFQNLTHLELLFAHGNYDFDIPIWLLRKVKTIDVKACWEYFEMSAVKNILSRADALERFCVSFSDVNGKQIDKQQKEEALVQALFMLPRVSTRCEIQFKGMVVSASTNDS